MNTLDALNRLRKSELIDLCNFLIKEKRYFKEYINETEKSLKALEIIKEKSVDVQLLKNSKNVNEYNWYVHTKDRALTQEEYDLLKEVL